MGKADDTRAALLRAAVKVIGRHGYSGATVDEIAEVAGVSKGNVYYHFKTKGDIATSVLVNGVQHLVTLFKQAIEESGSGVEALRRMIASFTQVVFSDPLFSRFMLTELWRSDRIWSEQMHALEEECTLLIQEQIERGQAEGALRTTLDPRFGAVAVLGTVLTSTQYYLLDDQGDQKRTLEEKSARFIDHVVDFISRALSA